MNHRPSTIPLKVGLVSLGCAKNLVDSEVMLGSLVRDGMMLTEDAREADVVIVNTCGFIDGAKRESIDAVLKANELRQTGRCKALIVAGCLTQRYPKDLQKELPEVDAIVGLNEVPRIGQIVREVLGRVGQASSLSSPKEMDRQDAYPTLFWSGPARYVPDYGAPRFRLTPTHYAYVKIAEGCNHPCTFCSIPRIRGRHRSRPMDDVLAEIRALVANGVREINLISQDTTFYGKDLHSIPPVTLSAAKGLATENREICRRTTDDPLRFRFAQNDKAGDGAPTLAELLRAIQQIPGEFWVRLLYTHPAHWTDELIETMAAGDKICRYVDMPLQHINDRMLERMRRETDGEYIRALIRQIRDGIPGIAVRTTFIVGFPGETEAEFEELLAFIKETQFERVGIFTYSQEDHTPAGDMSEQVPARRKKQRYRRAMALQQTVSREIHERLVGETLRVLIERQQNGNAPRAGRKWIGRSHADAPEIDGSVFVRGDAKPGEFADVRITGAGEYDITGNVV
ncbi:MAG TPA: 30S ribosomal protein S12 methylthiotransferase RimO [Verrucomicrobiae bacterium]|nr:30S ribosomal protein S12 methylthiotransferase RimO [Verrucomicrobiae bacterium]